jgi:DELLA protein
MDPAATASLSGELPLPSVQGAAASYCVDLSVDASVLPAVPPSVAEAEAARTGHEEEENAAIRLVHLLVTCANDIQAGDYAAATSNLAEARLALGTTVSTTTGIGRVTSHFAAALGQRLAAASPSNSDAAPDASELYRQFYEAGPYLKFAHFTANQAILEAFEGFDRVHVLDFAIMQGAQWPALIQSLSLRPGGPPALRITGIGPPPAADGSRDELNEVGVRLTEFARAVNVPFSFCGVRGDTIDPIQAWMFKLVPGEALAVNSICQLHRLLVDDVDPNSVAAFFPEPIHTVLCWITSMQPRVFTIFEQEADHNNPALVERFTNALFYYGALFDSMEAMSAHRRTNTTGGLGGEAYLQREIFDIVCGEGSGRVERHEPLNVWHGRLWRAGLAQTPLGPSAIRRAAGLLRSLCGAGYRVQERGDFLTLAWHDRPLFTASVWHAPPTNNVINRLFELLMGEPEAQPTEGEPGAQATEI